MILKIFKGEEFTKENLVRIYGGVFDFDYCAETKRIRVTSQVETKSYPCTKVDFSTIGDFCFVCTGEE